MTTNLLVLDPITQHSIIAVIIFLLSFILISIAWSFFVRLSTSLFSKTKFYYIPLLLREMNFHFSLLFILISLYVSVSFFDPSLFNHVIFKILGIIFTFTLITIIAKFVFSVIDFYYKKTIGKELSGIYRIMPAIKNSIGGFLYLIAFILSINIIDKEIGQMVAYVALAVGISAMFIFSDHLRNIGAGLQLLNYNLKEGDIVTVDEHFGFVESIGDRSSIIRTIEGSALIIPNQMFFRKIIELGKRETNQIAFHITATNSSPSKLKEDLEAICGKLALTVPDFPNDFKPRVFFKGVTNGFLEFVIVFKITSTELLKVRDQVVQELLLKLKTQIHEIKLVE